MSPPRVNARSNLTRLLPPLPPPAVHSLCIQLQEENVEKQAHLDRLSSIITHLQVFQQIADASKTQP